MSKIAQLRNQREELARQAGAVQAKYPADIRMSQDDAKKLDTILDDMERLDGEINREKRSISLLGDDVTPEQEIEFALNRATRTPGAHAREKSEMKAFMRGGINAMSQDAVRTMAARRDPGFMNAMSTVVSTEGGYTVAPEFMRELEQAMALYGGMRNVSTVFQTGTGAPLPFPIADATSEEGEWVSQNQQASVGETSFGSVLIEAHIASSKSLALPWALLHDSFLDLDTYIQELLGIRLGRLGNRAFTVGDGNGKPRGILVGAGVGRIGAAGQVADIDYNGFVDLEGSIDPAYRQQPGCGWMFHDDTLKVVRKIKDGVGKPIFVAGYDSSNPGGEPDKIFNKKIEINQHMPVMAANAKSILYGLLKKYRIRDVMDLTLFRMTDSKYTEKGQVGFIAFTRVGGNLVDAGKAVKYYQNAPA